MKEKLVHSLREEQTKLSYYIIALATTCIGFSVYNTRDSLLELNLIVLGGAVLFWGISIFFGFHYLRYTLSNLYANFKLLDARDGNIKLPEEMNYKGEITQEIIDIACEGIENAMEGNSKKSSWYGKGQLYLFYIGVLLFVIWHVLEIYSRTINS